jgi:transposase-like protein
MKGKQIPPELKTKIIKSFVDDGIPVKQLAQEYQLNPNTIYTWMKQPNSDILSSPDYSNQKLLLEVSRLKREKQELIDLIGRLTINVDALNKKKDKLF